MSSIATYRPFGASDYRYRVDNTYTSTLHPRSAPFVAFSERRRTSQIVLTALSLARANRALATHAHELGYANGSRQKLPGSGRSRDSGFTCCGLRSIRPSAY